MGMNHRVTGYTEPSKRPLRGGPLSVTGPRDKAGGGTTIHPRGVSRAISPANAGHMAVNSARLALR